MMRSLPARFLASLSALALLAFAAPAHSAWPPSGVPIDVTPGGVAAPVIARDDVGFTFVAWVGAGAAVVRLGPEGTRSPGWPAAGVHFPLWKIAIQADGLGGVYVVGLEPSEVQDPDGGARLRLLHFGPNGRPFPGWPADGIVLGDSAARDDPRRPLLARSVLGVLVAWPEVDPSRIRAQAVGLFGRRLWGPAGVLLASGSNERRDLQIIESDGGLMATWTEFTGAEQDVHAQKLTGAGARAPGWPSAGLGVCTAPGAQSALRLVADGAGGAYIAWSDFRTLGMPELFASHVGRSGRVAAGWPADGAPVARAAGSQIYGHLAVDGRGGAWLVWSDNRPGARYYDIYEQHLSAGLPAEYGEGGRLLVTASGFQVVNDLAPDGRGGFVVAWSDLRNGLDASEVRVLRCDASGMPRAGWEADGWLPVTREAYQYDASLAVDHHGRATVTWLERPLDDMLETDVWAQLVPRTPGAASAVVTEESDGPGLLPGEAYGTSVEPDAGGHSAPPPTEFAIRSRGAAGAAVVFRLPTAGEVTVDLFDASGRRVAGEPARFYAAGEHTVGFDRSALAKGVYFARVRHPGGQASAKVLVLR